MSFNIQLQNNTGDTFDTVGFSGVTSPRLIQQMTFDLWGESVSFTVSAPSIGLCYRDISKP